MLKFVRQLELLYLLIVEAMRRLRKNRMVTVVMLLVSVIVSIAIVIGDILRCVLKFVVVAVIVSVVVSILYCYCNHCPYRGRHWCHDCCVYSCFLLVASIVLGVFLLALIVTFVFSLFFLPLSFMVLMFLLFLLLLFFLFRMVIIALYDVQFLLRNPSHLARLTYESSTCFDGRSATVRGTPRARKRDEMSHKETLNL